MGIDRLKENLARLFLGRVSTHSRPLSIDAPELKSAKRRVEHHPLRAPERVLGTMMFGATMDSRVFGGVLPSEKTVEVIRPQTPVLRAKKPAVAGRRTGSFARPGVKKVNFIRVLAKKDFKRITGLPQERESRLHFARTRLSLREGEIPLALFWPLIHDSVIKTVLNRDRGTLLIWYNPYSRAFSPEALLLVRRLGPGGGTEWRWTGLKMQR